jgi:iron complex outermembrane receptor protein
MSIEKKRALLLCSAVGIVFSGFAAEAAADDAPLTGVQVSQAQTAPAPTTPAAPAPAESTEETKVERVVVTGSRLKKNEFTSSSPVQIITREDATLEGLSDTAELLQGATVASGSGQIDNTLSGFGGFAGGPGGNTISLRGLGAARTLVLVNGRRIGPAGVRGIIGPVELNTIPSSMIARTEILKDGGSTIYGSDAVAGVVNVITRQNIDGAFFEGTVVAPFDGGGETFNANAYWGTTFERGGISISGDYYKRNALTTGQRDYLNCGVDYVYNATTGALLDLIDPATGSPKCVDLLAGFANPSTGGVHIATPGLPAGGGYLPTLAPAIAGSLPDLAGWHRVGHSYAQVNTYINNLCANATHAAANAFCASPASIAAEKERRWRLSNGETPNDSPLLDDTTAISPAERYSAFVQANYNLFGTSEAYTELFFNRRESSQRNWGQIVPTIPVGHPFNPFGSATTRPFIPRAFQADQTVDFYRGLVGMRGDLGDKVPVVGGWSYDLFVQHTRSEGDYTQNFAYADRVAAASAAAGCNPALITISNAPGIGCPTINWFRPETLTTGVFSPEERAFLFGEETGHTTYSQSIVNGVITGDAFQLPYGPVSAALGFELRRDELDDTPGPQARATNFFGFTTAGRTAGEDSVAEAFGEVDIPILNGLRFAEDLSINASARYTNYESYGDGSTYKWGVNWQITPEYRLRGTSGTTFRAPALYEMFLANQIQFRSQADIDPCINWGLSSNVSIQTTCGAPPPTGLGLAPDYVAAGQGSATIAIGGGGPGVLNAEKGESRTVGFIWTPDWIEFSLGIDYWEIEINDEVARFGALNIVQACQRTLPFGSSPFCTLFNRNAAGGIVNINDSYVNLDSQVSDGLDLTARYVHEFPFGTFRADAQVTWTFTDEILIFATTALNDFNGELGDPDWTGRLNLRFERDAWTFFWNTDFTARASNDEEFEGSVFNWRSFAPVNGNAYYKQYTEFHASHDASVRYVMDDWSFVAGVKNIFDEQPPTVSTGSGADRIGQTPAVAAQYDVRGRSGFVTISKEF